MGWTVPWFSSSASDFNVDFGITTHDGETFGLSVFLRDRDSVFHSYFTNRRSVEALGSIWTFLDLTPLGRQETWEDSPEGYPQTKRYKWWNWNDSYVPGAAPDPKWVKVSDAGEAAFVREVRDIRICRADGNERRLDA